MSIFVALIGLAFVALALLSSRRAGGWGSRAFMAPVLPVDYATWLVTDLPWEWALNTDYVPADGEDVPF